MILFLWTDALLFLLLAAIGVFIFFAARSRPLREPWLRVLKSRMGMASLMVLLVYASIGVLDSVHYRPNVESASGDASYNGQVVSLLDTLAKPLITATEITYSAPFAHRAYVQSVITRADGSKAQVYPRLEFGGAHLSENADNKAGDIFIKSLVGAGWGLIAWLALVLVLVALISLGARCSYSTTLQNLIRDKTRLRWRIGVLTLGIIFVLCGGLLELAGHYHVLGTDKVGQDVFFEALKSVRTGLLIGTLTTLVMLPFALVLGIMAGYFKGWVDDLIQYLYTTLSSIPGVLLIVAAILMLQVAMENNPGLYETTAERADLRLLFLCLILGITSWTGLCRLLRAETLKLTEMEYVQAAHGLGVGSIRIMARHILPNVMHIVLIQIVLDFSALVLAEAVLSYIGVGVDPSMDSWGNMINGARLEMSRDPIVWWPLAAAFIFMLGLVLAANLFADIVRDAFDPRLRHGQSDDRNGPENSGNPADPADPRDPHDTDKQIVHPTGGPR